MNRLIPTTSSSSFRNTLFALVIFLLPALTSPSNVVAQEKPSNVVTQEKDVPKTFAPDRKEVYKTIGDVSLKMHIFEPDGHQATAKAPAIVLFFGGGWNKGTPKQFYEQSTRFASLGMVALVAEYRVKKRHKTTPFECVADGKSAIRWVREHAGELGVDPERIVAGGGSAGGHVACCSGTIEGHEQEGEDHSISSVPNAMILFNPVLDTTKKGFGAKRFKKAQQTSLSPCHHIRSDLPPTLVMHGTADTTVPFENATRFTKLMQDAGNRCQLESFEGAAHGFFNGKLAKPKAKNFDHYHKCMEASIGFLKSLQYLDD